jgi:hypothetical protein
MRYGNGTYCVFKGIMDRRGIVILKNVERQMTELKRYKFALTFSYINIH